MVSLTKKKDPWEDIKKGRRKAVRSEMAKRLKARGRVRGAVKGSSGVKVGQQPKAIGKKSSLAGGGFSARELAYAKAVRGARKRSGKEAADYASAVAKGRKQVGPKDPSKGNVKTATARAKASDYAYNVGQREKTKGKLASNVAKTKAHYAKLRKKGASAATMQKAKTKAAARSKKIKGQGVRRRTIIN